ncbi:hypothetical protein C2S51_014727 [Perilla frutescens var. frutescens]|nr:hypothetical protein C2S51_014727 [Perilla frutescens var. frutescens]
MSNRDSPTDKGKGKDVADSSEGPCYHRRTHSGVHISDIVDTTSPLQQQQQPEEYVNVYDYGRAASGFYNYPTGGAAVVFYNDPRTQVEVDAEVARWIQYEQLQQSQESRAFCNTGGEPSIDLDTEEAEEEETVPRNPMQKSALFTIYFRKVARKNEAGIFYLYCSYYMKQYKFRTGGDYGTYWSHITNHHPVELGRAQA